MIFTFHASGDIGQGDAVKITDSMTVAVATANTDNVIGIATLTIASGADVPVQLLGDVFYGWAGEAIAAPQFLTPTTAGSLAIATTGQSYFYVALCDAGNGEMVICMEKPSLTASPANDVEIVTVPMSFETNEQTITKIYFNYACTINKIRSHTVKALAGTDTGTVQGANSVGSSGVSGLITCAISEGINIEHVASPTVNNTVAKDSYYQLTSVKTTAGGKVLITLEVTKA